MTQFRIADSQVDPRRDPDLQQALERIYREQPFHSLHNRDTTFTREELSRILDYTNQHPQALAANQLTAIRNAFNTRFSAPPQRMGPAVFYQAPHPPFVAQRILTFGRTQVIQQRPNETSDALHERLRNQGVNSIDTLTVPSRIITPSWYTVDLSQILGIPDAVGVSTSTCVHEMPYRVLVGIR